MSESMSSLSEEQQKVIELCNEGKNIFLTGPGGTGKSYLIHQLYSMYPEKVVKVCALTGVAAELIGCKASTVHSWSGTGISKGSNDSIVQKIYNKGKQRNWLKVDLLIIDEVSMMSKKFFETLDYVGKKIRNNEYPFGGIQVIFSGDFYQLPPIGDDRYPDTSQFCFESKLWSQTFNASIVLKKIFRQKDKQFTKILQQVREGSITRRSYETLKTRHMENHTIDYDTETTIISPLRNVVKRVNDKHMDSLIGESKEYEFSHVKTDEYDKNTPLDIEKYEYRILESGLVADRKIKLKIGARVMCVVNLLMEGKKQIVNGSQGIVIGYVLDVPQVKFNNGLTQVMDYHTTMSEEIPGLGIKQIPLIHAWAITIHKSQGVTLDSAILDVGQNIFGPGQIYVALSRVKDLEGLYLKDFNPHRIKTNKLVTEFYKTLKN